MLLIKNNAKIDNEVIANLSTLHFTRINRLLKNISLLLANRYLVAVGGHSQVR